MSFWTTLPWGHISPMSSSWFCYMKLPDIWLLHMPGASTCPMGFLHQRSTAPWRKGKVNYSPNSTLRGQGLMPNLKVSHVASWIWSSGLTSSFFSPSRPPRCLFNHIFRIEFLAIFTPFTQEAFIETQALPVTDWRQWQTQYSETSTLPECWAVGQRQWSSRPQLTLPPSQSFSSSSLSFILPFSILLSSLWKLTISLLP